MTLEGAEGRIWCSKIGWQTVPCSWSIDGEAALTGSSPGARDQQSIYWRIKVNKEKKKKTRMLTRVSKHRNTYVL